MNKKLTGTKKKHIDYWQYNQCTTINEITIVNTITTVELTTSIVLQILHLF